MKKRSLCNGLLMGMLCLFIFSVQDTSAATGSPKSQEAAKFGEYRAAIKKEFGIDLKDYREKLKGGRADGKPITRYNLKQLLMGIKVEQEHTSDRMTALEIASDHLEEFSDYYTRLLEMEEEAEKHIKESEKKRRK